MGDGWEAAGLHGRVGGGRGVEGRPVALGLHLRTRVEELDECTYPSEQARLGGRKPFWGR